MKKKGGMWKGFGLAAAMPVQLVVAVLLGYEGGHFLDRRLLTTPWLGIAGVLVGVAVGFIGIYRMGSWLK